MTKKDLQKAMFETCNGDEDSRITSQLKLIVSGEDKVYSNLWKRVEVSHQQSNLVPSYERALKKIYSPPFGKIELFWVFKYRLNLSVTDHCIIMKLLLEEH